VVWVCLSKSTISLWMFLSNDDGSAWFGVVRWLKTMPSERSSGHKFEMLYNMNIVMLSYVAFADVEGFEGKVLYLYTSPSEI
jgi:uncharacterized protein YegJ (DUF2314 family)